MVGITNATCAEKEYERLGMSSTLLSRSFFFFFSPPPLVASRKALRYARFKMILQRGQYRARVCTGMKSGTSGVTS